MGSHPPRELWGWYCYEANANISAVSVQWLKVEASIEGSLVAVTLSLTLTIVYLFSAPSKMKAWRYLNNAVSKQEQLAPIKLLGIREVFPVIKTGTAIHRLQTRESAVTGSALLATDCSLDTWRLDGIGQQRCNGRGSGRGGDNIRLLDHHQLSAGCGFYATVLLFCSVFPVESTRFHCYLSQMEICDWHLCSASPPLPRVRVIFKGMRGIVMRGSLKQTGKGQCSVND